jgi:PBP1b-binding outer membrane lipoprotein LpoB
MRISILLAILIALTGCGKTEQVQEVTDEQHSKAIEDSNRLQEELQKQPNKPVAAG